jgi:hypothetical protein
MKMVLCGDYEGASGIDMDDGIFEIIIIIMDISYED